MSTAAEQVQNLYVAYFSRPADPAGVQYWSDVLDSNGANLVPVSAAFAASDEYRAAYAGLNHSQAVSAVYQNLFGRAGDAAGVAYWTKLLDNGAITMDGVVKVMAGAAQGSDLTVLNGKVAAASAFTTALDTPAEVLGYSDAASNQRAKLWLASIHDADSIAMATAPAAVAVKVIDVVAQHGATPAAPASTPDQISAITHSAELQKLWLVEFDAAADPLGLQYWGKLLDQGTPLVTVKAAFTASPAVADLYAGLTSAQAVDTLYKNLFGHGGDAASVQFWSGALDAHKTAMADVALTVGDGAKSEADAFTFYARLAVATAFTNELDTAVEVLSYTGNHAQTVVRNYLANVVDAASFATAIDPAAIHLLAESITWVSGTPVVGSAAPIYSPMF
ncbi:MAG: DUF4214 domain-containing protein [Pseudomonadota bacterium]